MKLLKDFPTLIWFPAADECEHCKAPYEVRILHIDPDRDIAGVVEIRAHHAPSCMDNDGWENEEDVIGWDYYKYSTWIRGRKMRPFSKVANIAPCSNCDRIITGVPLILWGPDTKSIQWELHFCDDCVKLWGIDRMIAGATHR